MGILIAIAFAVLLFIIYRIATRKRRNARRKRKAERRAVKAQRRYSRTVRSRGTSAVRICTDTAPNGQVCGLPRGKCQHLRRQAEHAEGMQGRKK